MVPWEDALAKNSNLRQSVTSLEGLAESSFLDFLLQQFA